MEIDFKITVWERMIVAPERQNEVLEKLKSGEITSSDDLMSLFPDDVYSNGLMLDTCEQMSVSANDGFTTIEAMTSSGETLWENR